MKKMKSSRRQAFCCNQVSPAASPPLQVFSTKSPSTVSPSHTFVPIFLCSPSSSKKKSTTETGGAKQRQKADREQLELERVEMEHIDLRYPMDELNQLNLPEESKFLEIDELERYVFTGNLLEPDLELVDRSVFEKEAPKSEELKQMKFEDIKAVLLSPQLSLELEYDYFEKRQDNPIFNNENQSEYSAQRQAEPEYLEETDLKGFELHQVEYKEDELVEEVQTLIR
jgi:hypothetical protein